MADESSLQDVIDAIIVEYGYINCAVNPARIVGCTSGLAGSERDVEAFDDHSCEPARSAAVREA